MEIRRICRIRTGIFDPLLEDGGDDLSSASGVGGSSGLLGSTGVDGMQNHMMWTNGFTTP